MTVRAWFTISAVALLVLGVAFAVRFTQPAKAPALFATAGTVRLPATYKGSCWPQPRGGRRCEPDPRRDTGRGPAIDGTGTIRVVADYPVQPDEGALIVEPVGGGEPVLTTSWSTRLAYDLPPGQYLLKADARYPSGGYVRFDFPFTVR